MRITKVYTKQGDKGTTRLGGGQAVGKDSLRIRAYGTVDELNSCIGLALSFEPAPRVATALTQIQHQLFTVGGDLCVLEADKKKWGTKGVDEQSVAALETLIDELNGSLKPLEEFILPGGTRVAAFLHVARCVCRRAESLAVELAAAGEIGPCVIKYLNRLSDALFVLARFENLEKGGGDVYWEKDKLRRHERGEKQQEPRKIRKK